MSEESMSNSVKSETNFGEHTQKICQTVNEYSGKVDSWVEKLLDLVGDHPWEKWLKAANGLIGRFLPALIALAGVLGLATSIVTAIKFDAPFSYVVKPLWMLVPIVFSMHLAPKALSLTRSFIEKNESETMRPELIYILKVILGLGMLLLAAYLVFQFEADMFKLAIVALIVSVLTIIVFSNPSIIGVKSGYPTNGVEEAIAVLLLPVRIVLALLTLLVGCGTVGVIVYGVVLWFDNGFAAAAAFGTAVVAPLLIPLAAYLLYLVIVFTLDFYRALVSIPRKLDELKR